MCRKTIFGKMLQSLYTASSNMNIFTIFCKNGKVYQETKSAGCAIMTTELHTKHDTLRTYSRINYYKVNLAKL